ncbi:uncharacterized protein CELE_E_BE45912.2 [Caenorhabditis elegans]|uniref:Uncharacterized protein n=1 Tax=Caenorhabditis elegans TaxID=6239 RepID=Q8ITZ9_CAEEL|nr:Uncharacterized protein CELE_E_BE45912.2 [Caenorhabditis elegans]CCD62284.1 Uncharacterized protein CELE_E_BE45912.2 [Caenorhabditis elegans]|eukprot:NP_871649.3 Uncharacterized protein CELE_E_BE45912.2 [Caenorhabditis elegans]
MPLCSDIDRHFSTIQGIIDLKLIYFGFFVLLGFVLNIVGVVTPCFLVETNRSTKKETCHWVNPFSTLGYSYDLASFFLYATIFCQCIIGWLIGSIVNKTKIKKSKYSKEILSRFDYIKWLFMLIIVLNVLSFVLIEIQYDKRFQDGSLNLSYQTFVLAICTCIVCPFNITLSKRLVRLIKRVTQQQNSAPSTNQYNLDTTNGNTIAKI